MEQAPAAQPKKQKQPAHTVIEEPDEKKPEYQFKAENEGTSVYAYDLTSDNGPEEITVKKKSKDRFSLKKAVIYSEILNRKYT